MFKNFKKLFSIATFILSIVINEFDVIFLSKKKHKPAILFYNWRWKSMILFYSAFFHHVIKIIDKKKFNEIKMKTNKNNNQNLSLLLHFFFFISQDFSSSYPSFKSHLLNLVSISYVSLGLNSPRSTIAVTLLIKTGLTWLVYQAFPGCLLIRLSLSLLNL